MESHLSDSSTQPGASGDQTPNLLIQSNTQSLNLTIRGQLFKTNNVVS